MSQRSTVTGSIGVLMARMNLQGFLEKLSVNRAGVNRGAHAGIFSEARPMRPDERELLWNLIQDTYDEFKAVVVEARHLAPEQMEEVAGGRVWTGRQAMALGLVDAHGDFIDALNRAAELGGVAHGPEHALRVKNLYPDSGAYLPPQPADAVAALVERLAMPQMRSLNGRVLALMPFELRLF
jgi:protease-4